MAGALFLGESVGWVPPKPSTGIDVWAVWSAAVLDARAAEDMAAETEALPLKGSWAPHGWSARHESAQAWSPPQLFTHWLPHSVQM